MKPAKIFFIFVLLFSLAGAMAFSALGTGAVNIVPHTPTTNDQLFCSVASGSGYTYYWYQNGQLKGISGAYVAPTYTNTGDTWTCVVKKYYGPQVGWITIGDDTVTILSGQPPIANITAPPNGTSFNYSQSAAFSGTAIDPETGALTGNSLVWRSSINGQIGTGNTFSISTLSVGNHTITLTATDPEGLTGTASIAITILGVNHVPAVTIVTPNNNTNFTVGSAIDFRGTAYDSEDGTLTGASLAWTSSISGNFGTGTNVNFSGLPVGIQTITLTATDSAGAIGNASITVNVLPLGQSPNVSIINPVNNQNYTFGLPINFLGNAVDPEDGVLLGNSLVWTSNINGNFGNGTNFNINLSLGDHTITLTARDSTGNSVSASVLIHVIIPFNFPPNVSIISPVNGQNYTFGLPINFLGSAFDPEDGILGGNSMVWTSSINGNVGNGTSFSTNLSLGNHTITLTARDSANNTASASVNIIVSAASINHNPTLLIINPADGANFTCNSAVSFQAITSDPDGDNVTLTWASNINGNLGSGTPLVISNLTCGATHVITALASDGRGGINQSQITINILPFSNPAPTVTINLPLNNSQFIRACGNVNFAATATAFGGASIRSYNWIYNGNTIGNNASFSVPVTTFALGNNTITLLVEDTYNSTATASVTISLIPHTAPTVQILNPLNNTAFWDWQTILFNAVATPSDSCPTNFTWIWRDNNNAVINNSQSFSAQLPIGNHTITAYAVDAYNATGFDQIFISINSTPNALPFVSITSPVNGTSFVRDCQTITFTSNAFDVDGNITAYSWFWGSTLINSSANFTRPASYFGAGNQTVLLIVRDNRNNESTATANFIVVPHVAPTVTITSPLNNSNYTEIATVPFSATAAANDICPTNFTYTWTDNSIIINNSPSFSLSNMLPGIHTIMVLATDSYTLQDSDVIYLNITVIPNQPPVILTPITCVNALGGNILNEYEPIFCSANATDVDGNITQWTWSIQNSYGPFFTPYNFSVPYPYLGNGTYNVTLYVVDDDNNQTTASVLIDVQNNVPLVTLTSNVTGGVEPQRIMFTCSVTQGNKPYTYNFNFGNGVTDVYTGNGTSVNFSINYPQNGTFSTVCTVTDFDGDMGSATLPITITDTVPAGNFNFTPQTPLECTNVQFTSNASAYDGILSYFWDFADGRNSTSQNPVHNFTNNANYNVALTVLDMDNSPATFTNMVAVQDTNPLVDAGPDREVIEGNNLTFVGSAIKQCDNITGYQWNFGDGTPIQTGQVVSHNFTRNGTFLVILTVTDSDSAVSDNLTVVVNDTVPTANGFASPNPVVEGNQVILNASLSTGYDQPLSYEWNINGTIYNTGTNPILPHIFGPYNTTSPVIINVILTVTDSDGSQDNATVTVVVLDSVPVADATVATPNPIYEGQTVTFDSSLSILNIDSPFNYTWYFGDGNITTTQAQVITHVYQQNGTYLVRLVVTDSDGSSDDDFVTVNVLDTVPAVNFIWNPASPFEGMQVNFTDLTTAYDNLSQWRWEFGDGNTSTVQNATHTYTYEGTYNVTLYVKDFDDSQWSNMTQQLTVQNLLPQLTFTATPSSGNELLNVTFNCSASGNAPFAYTVEFGDSTSLSVVSSSEVLTSKTYLNGTYAALCSVTDIDGDTINSTAAFFVNDLSPSASFTGNTSLFQGETGFYNASASTSYPDPISGYEWDWDYTGIFTVDSQTLGPIANHTFYTPGLVTVAMRVVDSDSTSAPAFLVVNVTNVAPTVSFNPNAYSANESDNITFTVSFSDPGFDAVSFEWDWSYNGTFAAENSTIVNSTVHSWPDDASIPFLVAVVGIDQWGGRSNVSTAVVTISNVPPVPSLNLPLYICSNDSASANSNITLLATVLDPGADQWTYLWNITNGITTEQFFDLNSLSRQSNLTYHCAGRPLGLYNVTLQVMDGDGGVGNTSTIISVTNGSGNNPPFILSPSEGQMIGATVGTVNLIPISVFDADQNLVTLYNNASLTIQNVTPAGYFTYAQIAFLPAVEGLTQVNLTACDNSSFSNNCSSRLFTINATRTNNPPTAVLLGGAGQEGIAVSLDGTLSFDIDNDTISEYRWDFGDGQTFNGTLPAVTHIYDDNGTYTATLRVVDALGFVSTPDPAVVSIFDVAPAISGLQSVTFNEDSSLTITMTVADVIADPMTSFSVSGNDVNFAVTSSQTGSNTVNLTFTPVPNWNGFRVITFTAANKDASSSLQINVTVVSVNDVPEVNAIPSQNLTEDSLFSYQVIAADNDTLDTLTYLISGPAGMAINSTGAISWTPDNMQVATYNVVVQVMDSANATTSRSFTITVQNNPTQILNFNPPANATVGMLYQYDVNSSDEGVGDIFSLPVAPVGMTINSASGLINWIPLPSQTGFFPVTVQANDTHGGIDSRSYVIFVAPSGTLGVSIIATPSSQPAPVNGTAFYTITVTNTGNLSDSYTLIFNNVDGANVVTLLPNATGTITSTSSQTAVLTVNASQNLTYNVIVTAVSNTNAAINASVTVPTTFTFNPGDSMPPVITGISAGSITNVSAIISWNTNESSTSIVNYGTTTALGTPASNGAYVLIHSMPLASLLPNTTYYYNVTSCDISGNCATSGPLSFATLANGVPPLPANGTVINSTISGIFYLQNTTAQVNAILGYTGLSGQTWVIGSTVTDNPTISIVNGFINRSNITNSWVNNANITLSRITNSNITNATLYNVTYTNVTFKGGSDNNSVQNGGTNIFDPILANNLFGGTNYVYGATTTIYNSVFYNIFVNLSYIDFSNLSNVTITQSIVISCTVNNSRVTDGSVLTSCIVLGSDIINSTIDNSTIINSTINDSTIIDSNITDSNITNSTINDSTIIDSNITDSNLTNSTVDNCTISGSDMTNAQCNGDIITNSTINGTEVCGGTVNGHVLGNECIYFPTITSFSVPGSAYVDADVSSSVSISNRNSSSNSTPEPYTYLWNTGETSTKNGTSDSITRSYSSTGTYTVRVTVSNKYGLSATRAATISIDSQSSGNNGGDGHSGSGSGVGGGNSGIVSGCNKIDLEHKTPQKVYVDYFDGICFDYSGITYTITFNNVSERSLDMTIRPPKIPVTMLVHGSTLVNLDDEPTDDLSIILNSVDRVVINDLTAGIGRVRYKINLTLNLVKLEKKKIPLTVIKPTNQTKIEQVVNEIKSGVLDVIASVTPNKKPSPIVGTTITGGIIIVGLAGYLVFRKREPKFPV